jgi:hypothetical protein
MRGTSILFTAQLIRCGQLQKTKKPANKPASYIIISLNTLFPDHLNVFRHRSALNLQEINAVYKPAEIDGLVRDYALIF